MWSRRRQDGSGYFVTRYDVNGTYKTIVGRHHPGENETPAPRAGRSTHGVWTQNVAYTLGGFDYDPDATPTGSSWADFLSSVFHLTNPDAATTTSYEFDYYNACGNHWRDSFYNGSFMWSGSIGDCP
jgi:hypothetical protein